MPCRQGIIFEWARWGEAKNGFKVGSFHEAREFRKEAVEAEKQAMEANMEGDGGRAWKEGEAAKVAAYKAAKDEAMRQ